MSSEGLVFLVRMGEAGGGGGWGICYPWVGSIQCMRHLGRCTRCSGSLGLHCADLVW